MPRWNVLRPRLRFPSILCQEQEFYKCKTHSSVLYVYFCQFTKTFRQTLILLLPSLLSLPYPNSVFFYSNVNPNLRTINL